MSTCHMLIGISGTGKGTRMSTLIEYLKTKSTDYESIFLKSINDTDIKKPYQIALRFNDLGITFFGRWVKSNKLNRLISWSSLDSFSTYQEHYPKLMEMFNKDIFCSEGYYATRGSWMSPESIRLYGYEKFHCHHFLYKELEDLQQRCLGRSGARIKGSCWGDNQYYLREGNQEKTIQSFVEKCRDVKFLGYQYDFNSCEEPVYFWGAKVITESLPTLDASEFVTWAKENNTLRHVDKAVENSDKYSKYLLGDTTNIKYVVLPTIVPSKEVVSE